MSTSLATYGVRQLTKTRKRQTILKKHICSAICSYPCRGFLRCDRGKVNLVTIPSGPNTDDGILSKESESDFVSADCSCKLFNKHI